MKAHSYSRSRCNLAPRPSPTATLSAPDQREFIDSKAMADISTVILAATDVKDKRKTNNDMEGSSTMRPLAREKSLRKGTVSKSAWLDVRAKSTVPAWAVRKGARYMLCTLGTAPCTKR